MDLDITPLILDKFKPRKKTIGRYSVSDIYAIHAGWTTPDHFFEPKPTTFPDILRMYSGTLNHNFIEGMLPKDKCEKKVEYKYKDIIIVGKADYLPDDNSVWDFKTSDNVMAEAKPWAKHQVKMYCTMFERRFGMIMQPVILDDKIIVRNIGTVERDDEWFSRELEKLYAFHNTLVDISKSRPVDN